MRKISYLLILLLFGAIVVLLYGENFQTSKNNNKNILNVTKKPIYDATLYRNKNTKNRSFFPPITILYRHMLFPGSNEEIDIAYLKKLAKSLPKTNIAYMLDIEHWNTYTPNNIEANKNIDKYILVIDTMKHARPDLKFGYYGILPSDNAFTYISGSQAKINRCLMVNNRLKRLASHVDVLFPSLYARYEELDKWKIFASEAIKNARMYKKPIYPLIWPQFSDVNQLLKDQYIPKVFWKEQLIFLNSEADGIIIWGGYKQEWDDNASWWMITKSFIEK